MWHQPRRLYCAGAKGLFQSRIAEAMPLSEQNSLKHFQRVIAIFTEIAFWQMLVENLFDRLPIDEPLDFSEVI